MHRSSLEASLGQDLSRVVEWTAGPEADVVLGVHGRGRLAGCAEWPGLEGALALIRAGHERSLDLADMDRLQEVGRALASEQDLDALLDRILTLGRGLVEAEAGSIYLAQGEELEFVHAQNARVRVPYARFQVPVSGESVAGYAALTGRILNIPDAYAIPPEAPYRFHTGFDDRTGYRCRSMLVVPIKDPQGEILGVLQFINRLEGGEPVPFRTWDERLAPSLAAQAGVAIRNARLRQDILEDKRNMERLNEVGKALASEQDLDRLLDLVLTHGRSLLRAEGGSIYLKEGGDRLLFAHTQNERVDLPFTRATKAIAPTFMAGFVAGTGETLNLPDVYAIPGDAPYRFDDSFDRLAGYTSRSMLVVPIQDTRGEILGVLQFINRVEEEGGAPVPFRTADAHLAQSLAAQAGVAVKNAHLRRDIEHLFESFVDASVKAIEQRDPVTRGHSGRVAELTVGLAEAVNRTSTGPYGGLRFGEAQLREIRYASLLHDFGKVGVREKVLVKSKKLEEDRLALLLQRLRQRQEEATLEALREDWAAGRPFDPARWEAILARQEVETASLMDFLRRTNEPTVLTQELEDGLGRLEALTFAAPGGGRAPLLESGDLACLSIRRGSLSDEERLQIESHVTHTFQFLSKIPWTPDLARVPDIAYGHHERINGQGYPRGLAGEAILPQSRAMAITDIFDALTAQDRPYKAAVPLERSLDILRQDAKGGHLDPDLLDIFIGARVFERTVPCH
ncbi:MAG TPA: GAF domain-containing protein [Holophaga sp.]|nr:GAF domain-containing protein [Holophaga sp.]